MKIYVKDKKDVKDSIYQYPSVLLVRNDWDDYGYKSLFEAFFQDKKYNRIPIGDVKILHKGRRSPVLKNIMEHLPSSTCSLGQNLNYYRQANELLGDEYYKFLDVMNDVTYLPGLYEEFRRDNGFTKSLLRDKDANKALDQADKIHSIRDIDNRNFSFSVKLKDAEQPHKVKFDFNIESSLPGRLIAIIGKNGTGKTQYISRMAHELGKKSSDWEPIIDIPPFNRVIAISFSPFDVFKIPERTRKYNYSYCGIRDTETKKLLSKQKLLKRLKDAGLDIVNERKHNKWKKMMRKILDDESLDLIEDELLFKAEEDLTSGFPMRISSGQLAQVIVFSELIAKLRPRSLLLFDEPEIHMHPTALSHLIRTLHDLMEEYDSVGILCTHSPIVIQEIPSRNVYIFERKGNIPLVRKPEFETFGENITNITEAIFDTIEIEANYKSEFRQMIDDGKSMQEIESLFEGRLSFNARIFIESLIAAREK